MAKGKIEIDRERCKGCLLCAHFCPKEAIAAGQELNAKGYYPAQPATDAKGESQCTGCAICATVCPDVAIEVYRE